LLSAGEFVRLPQNGMRRELVRGHIVERPMPDLRHGVVCAKTGHMVSSFLDQNDVGRTATNDSFVRTRQNPDTVRGADGCFISFERLPRGPIPEGLLDAIPELIFEIRSPSDRLIRMIAKATEYIEAGVMVVCIIDPQQQKIMVYRQDDAGALGIDDVLTLSDVLPGFSVPVRKFFD
jgi:Uma2 family endonuclease